MAQIAAEFTPAEIGAAHSLAGSAQTMIGDLALTGSAQYTQSVETFQILWNDYRDIVNAIFIKAGLSARWFQLDEDGRYGRNTAKALGLMTGGAAAGFLSAPPRRAAGIPVWYAQNKDAVNAMAPMQVAAGEMPPLNQPTGPPTSDQQIAQDLIEQAKSGSLVRDFVDPGGPVPAAPLTNPVCPPGTVLPAGCRWEGNEFWCPEGTTAAELRAAGCYDASEQVVTAQPTPIFDENGVKVVATRTRGLTPIIAVLFGAAAIGGWWFWRRPRRRRAA